MADYDLIVIGAGPAGFTAAVRGWDYGKRVALIEKGPLGGVGVHDGALSSKTLWELSKDYRKALRQDRGFVAQSVELDYRQVIRCVEQALAEKVGQFERQLTALSQPRQGQPGSVTLVRGTARFLDANTVAVDGDEGKRVLTGERFVVATGSRPRELPGTPVDGRLVLSSDHLMSLREFPSSLVIVGAGVVGCEFATIFANFGQTKVYLVDRADRILPFEDEDVSRTCSRNLEAKGVTIHHRASLVAMTTVGDEVEYTIEHHTGGRETIRVERALISIGRIPNTESLDLDLAGVNLTDRGHIVHQHCVTSADHIYAVGDVTADVALVSVGELEARHAVECMYAGLCEPLSYDNICSIYFLDPEVAGCGMSELEAQKKRIPYRVASYGYGLISRAVAMRSTDGFMKLLVTDDDEMRILGMRALGPHSSAAIEAVSLIMSQGRSVKDLADVLHPHPAITEGVQDCIRMLLGTSIWKPHVFQSELRLSRVTYADDGTAQQETLRKEPKGK